MRKESGENLNNERRLLLWGATHHLHPVDLGLQKFRSASEPYQRRGFAKEVVEVMAVWLCSKEV